MKKKDLKIITLGWYQEATESFKRDMNNQSYRASVIAYRNVLQIMGYSYKDLIKPEFVKSKIDELKEKENKAKRV